MAKRKCVRRAIVEVSDTDSDAAADNDCVIVPRNHVTTRPNKATSRPSATSPGLTVRGRVKGLKRKGESHVISEGINKRSGKTKPKVVRNRVAVSCDRKRKKPGSKNDTMGAESSKSNVSNAIDALTIEQERRNAELLRREIDVQKKEALAREKELKFEQLQREKLLRNQYQQEQLEEQKKSKKLQEELERERILKDLRSTWQEKDVRQQQELQTQHFGQQQIPGQQQAPTGIYPRLDKFPMVNPRPMVNPSFTFNPPPMVNRSPMVNPMPMVNPVSRASPLPLMQTRVVPPSNTPCNAKPKVSDTADSYLSRLATSNIRCVDWTEIDYIRETNGISKNIAENIVKLLKEDNTIPFIARYRKTMTQSMDADELRAVKNSYEKAKVIKQKAAAIIKEIDTQGKWSPEIHAFVQSTKSLNDLEQIQSMFKVTKGTLATRARDLGLDVPAQAIMNGERIGPLFSMIRMNCEGLKTEQEIKDGIVCILADMINKDKSSFEKLKKLRNEIKMSIEVTKAQASKKDEAEPKSNKQKNEESKYDLYHNFSAYENNIKSYQVLAINRGETRKILKVKVNIPDSFEHAFKEHCTMQYSYARNASPLHKSLLTAASDYAWSKLVKPSIKRRMRQELSEKSEIDSMDVFATNVKQLLLTPPLRGKVVIGIDPGFHHGCKLAVISEQGDVLETDTIHPHDRKNHRRQVEAERTLCGMVLRHRCSVVALGNGTACRETEVFLTRLIKKNAFDPVSVVYTIVDEGGASIYSCSKEASTEFPGLDVNVVSAISIARRLQDPMAELVKIEPKHLGVGMYQHDLPQTQLAAKLNEVIMEAVSFVGVDVNTASLALLKRVAGLGDVKAKNIIAWRKTSGPFRTRNDLKNVKLIGPKTFEQCAGFIRIIPETAVESGRGMPQDTYQYLDQTWIHPESYEIAKKFVTAAMLNPREFGTRQFIDSVTRYANQGYKTLAKKFNTDVDTIEIIVKGLSMEKGQDIRAERDESMFRESLTSLDDLNIGTVLTGVVRNITHFGAFVDVGVETDGLIHKKFFGGMTVNVGQRVETKVNTIEKERGRLGLTLIKCI